MASMPQVSVEGWRTVRVIARVAHYSFINIGRGVLAALFAFNGRMYLSLALVSSLGAG
jgi:hypothetical protein